MMMLPILNRGNMEHSIREGISEMRHQQVCDFHVVNSSSFLLEVYLSKQLHLKKKKGSETIFVGGIYIARL